LPSPQCPVQRKLLSSSSLIDPVAGPEHIAIKTILFYTYHIIEQETGEEVSNIGKLAFRSVLEPMCAHGISRLIASIAGKYRRSLSRRRVLGMAFSDDFRFRAEKHSSMEMAPEATKSGIRLDCFVSPNLKSRYCIDSLLLQGIHTQGIPARQVKARSQRQYCNCAKSLDIGRWFKCSDGCIYSHRNPTFDPPGIKPPQRIDDN